MDKCPKCGFIMSWDTAGNQWCNNYGWGTEAYNALENFTIDE